MKPENAMSPNPQNSSAPNSADNTVETNATPQTNPDANPPAPTPDIAIEGADGLTDNTVAAASAQSTAETDNSETTSVEIGNTKAEHGVKAIDSDGDKADGKSDNSADTSADTSADGNDNPSSEQQSEADENAAQPTLDNKSTPADHRDSTFTASDQFARGNKMAGDFSSTMSTSPSYSTDSTDDYRSERTQSQPLALWLVVVLLIIAVAWLGWQWHNNEQLWQNRAQDIERHVQDAKTAYQKEVSALSDVQSTVNKHLATVDERQKALAAQAEALLAQRQELEQGRHEVMRVDVMQSLLLAEQQLALLANVPQAIKALQNAESRLSSLKSTSYLPLRRAIAQDLAALKALPNVDMNDTSLKLETLITASQHWPLLGDARLPASTALNQQEKAPAPTTVAAAQPLANEANSAAAVLTGTDRWLEQAKVWAIGIGHWCVAAGREMWQELKGLVRIQRLDRQDVILLAPEQNDYLRANIRLRLLNARLALLEHQAEIFQLEIKAVKEAVSRYFDPQDAGVKEAMQHINSLAQSRFSAIPVLQSSSARAALEINGEKP